MALAKRSPNVRSLDAAKLKKQHEAHIDRWESDGKRTLMMKPPCGCPAFKMTVPSLRGGVWTSLVVCVHCLAQFMTKRVPNKIECGPVLPVEQA